MTESRELRSLVPLEISAVIAVAVVPWPELVPPVLPLVIAATLARYVRRRSWAQVARGDVHQIVVGAITGVAALALALILGAPLIEAVAHRSIEWSMFPIVRGSPTQLLVVCLIVIVTAIAAELALRGWVVERALELSGRTWIAVACGALAEAVITPGDIAARLGAGCFGAGLGAIYVAAGRTVVPAACARIAFALGALILEATQVVG